MIQDRVPAWTRAAGKREACRTVLGIALCLGLLGGAYSEPAADVRGYVASMRPQPA